MVVSLWLNGIAAGKYCPPSVPSSHRKNCFYCHCIVTRALIFSFFFVLFFEVILVLDCQNERVFPHLRVNAHRMHLLRKSANKIKHKSASVHLPLKKKKGGHITRNYRECRVLGAGAAVRTPSLFFPVEQLSTEYTIVNCHAKSKTAVWTYPFSERGYASVRGGQGSHCAT